jgi:cytochrome c oxidase cbb3-type subunit 2
VEVVAFVRYDEQGKWRRIPVPDNSCGSASIETATSIKPARQYMSGDASAVMVKRVARPAPSEVRFSIAQPRDFTAGVFKFRTTPTDSLPLDSDLYRTITAGIRGTAMPPWFNLPEQDRWDVIHYIKTFSPDFKAFPPGPPIAITRPPTPTPELIAKGKKVFEEMMCWECHGNEGKGDGPKSDTMKDDFGSRIPPANFTKGVFKSGPRSEDIFRTFMTGLSGTPMPSFSYSFTSPDDGWALTYFVLSLSADVKP